MALYNVCEYSVLFPAMALGHESLTSSSTGVRLNSVKCLLKFRLVLNRESDLCSLSSRPMAP